MTTPKNTPAVRLATALALALAMNAPAQGTDASRADAPVPASTYRSVLAEYRPATPAQDAPPANWRAANAAVARQGPMHGKHGMAGDAMEKPPASPLPQAKEHHHEH